MTNYETFTGLESYAPTLKDRVKGKLLSFCLRIKKAIQKHTAKKPRVMETNEYMKLISFMDVFHFQQHTRRQSIRNMRGVGQ